MWSNGIDDLVAGRVDGLTTTVATRFETVPSSKVMKSAVVPERYSGLDTIFETHRRSHVSPAAIGQSCMSSQRFGVMTANAVRRSPRRSEASGPAAIVPSGRSHLLHRAP
jgi:hypothetical protein